VVDVVQEVVTKLMERPGGQGIPPGTQNIGGFLWVATTRAALNAVAKEQRARQDPLAEHGTPGELRNDENFEEGIDDALICEQLDSSLDILTDDERYAYVQRFKHGRSLADIGPGLGAKSDSWAARLSTRALRKLTAAAGIETEPRSRRTKKRKEGDDE
jgi:DNA-directed RNA polymerase specialized sigma24 family protein